MSAEFSRNAVVWDGDNIEAVMHTLPPDNPPQYLSGYSNSDAIVGVWTPSGLKVAQIGDTIGIGEDGHPYVARRSTETRECPAADGFPCGTCADDEPCRLEARRPTETPAEVTPAELAAATIALQKRWPHMWPLEAGRGALDALRAAAEAQRSTETPR